MKLTKLEAEELFIVATNGYANGEYYEGRNEPKNHAAFCRAIRKLREEMRKHQLGENKIQLRTLMKDL